MLRFIKNLFNPEVIMADDHEDLTNLRLKVNEYKTSIAALESEVRKKQEKFIKIDKDMAKLNSEMQEKDKRISDLQTKVNQMQDSMRDMAAQVNESKNLVVSLKSELGIREEEVSMLRKENFKLSNKLKRSSSPSNQTDNAQSSSGETKIGKIGSNNAIGGHEDLVQMNQSLSRELDTLNKQVQLLSRKNLELTVEIERRSKTSEQIKCDYDEAMQSRKHLEEELKNLRGKVDALYNGSSIKANDSPLTLPKEPPNKPQDQQQQQKSSVLQNTPQLNTVAPSRLPVYKPEPKENQKKSNTDQQNEVNALQGTRSKAGYEENEDYQKNAISNIRSLLQNKLQFPSSNNANSNPKDSSLQDVSNTNV